MKKILIVATVQSHVAQFHVSFIKALKKENYEVHIAAKDDLEKRKGISLLEPNRVYNLNIYRSPFKISNFKAVKQLKKIINENEYDIIHCHTPMGSVVARIAAKEARKKGTKVIYTAHGFHFYKGAPLLNWLFYYPVEKYLSKKTDLILTINKEDYNRAAKKFKKTKVEYINGVGINPDKFLNPALINLHKEFPNIDNPFILTFVGELNDNKNQAFLIESMAQITKKYSNIVLALVGNGTNKQKYEALINKNNLNNNVKLLGYRTDVPSIFNETNIVVSSSKREGMGINLLEGMILKKVVVATSIRGHKDLIEDGVNGYLYKLNDKEKFITIVEHIYNNYNSMNDIAEKAFQKAKHFSIDNVNEKLMGIIKQLKYNKF